MKDPRMHRRKGPRPREGRESARQAARPGTIAPPRARAPALASGLLLALVPLVGCKLGRTGVPEGARKTWAQMDKGERLTHMTDAVSPRLEAVFQAFDAQRFGDFGCHTCHGSGADDGSYAMPSPDLPHLREAGYYKEHRKAQPEMIKFMWKEVEPNVAEAMGLTHGHKGAINCETCHVIE